MSSDRIRTKFQGVYVKESASRRFRGKPDQIFSYFVQTPTGRTEWIRVGMASEGITAEYARNKRVEHINMLKLGENPNDKIKLAASLDTAFDRYIENATLEGKHVGSEKSRYAKHLQPKFGTKALSEISEEQLTRHKAKLLGKLSPASVKQVFALLRRVINYGLRKKLWSGSSPIGPQSEFKMPRVENRGERFLTRQEADSLLEELNKRSPLIHDMAFLALRTGLRSTEIFKLRGGDIDQHTNSLYINAKGGKRQTVYADDDVIGMLLEYERRPDELVFQTTDGSKLRTIYKSFARAVEALKLNDGVTDTRNRVWFHTLRHTFISWLAQTGEFSLQELMEAARHERIETTLRYAHMIPGGTRNKIIAASQTIHGQSQQRRKSALVALPSKRRVP